MYEGSSTSSNPGVPVFKNGNKRQENDNVIATDYGFTARDLDIAASHRERLNRDPVNLAYVRNMRRTPEKKLWPFYELSSSIHAMGCFAAGEHTRAELARAAKYFCDDAGSCFRTITRLDSSTSRDQSILRRRDPNCDTTGTRSGRGASHTRSKSSSRPSSWLYRAFLILIQ